MAGTPSELNYQYIFVFKYFLLVLQYSTNLVARSHFLFYINPFITLVRNKQTNK